MVFGEKCVELVKEASRETSELIGQYNKDLVKGILEEMSLISKILFESLNLEQQQKRQQQEPVEDGSNAIVDEFDEQMEEILDPDQKRHLDSRNKLLVHKVLLRTFLWNKRCLLAYHYNRLEKLKKIRWQLGAMLPNEVRCNISDAELNWFISYSKNLSQYMNRLNDNKGIDLTLMRNPPKKLYVQVRCLTEYGSLELDNDGTVVYLSKDSMHYLPLSKCEKLIHQGILEQII